MQVLWNAIPTQKFRPARGIRQGCPLSPYLFFLCMEWLGLSICKDIDVGNWSPIRLSRGGPPLSHLFFTDDLILFGNADRNQARVIKSVDDNLGELLSGFFSFQKVTNLGNLIGVLLLHDKVTNSTLNFVVERTMMVPKGICDEPKSHRDLGLRQLKDYNTSFMMKVGFNIISNTNALWIHVLRSKYIVPSGLPDDLSRSRCSFLWRSISEVWTFIRENLIWSVGDGSSISAGKILGFLIFVPCLSLSLILLTLFYIVPLTVWLQGTTSTGSFSLKSAYEKVCKDTFNVKDRIWELPWKFHGPHRIRFFIWLALKHRLLTNSERLRRGFGSSSACSLCGHDYEDVVHILKDCIAARRIWDKLIP
ncbi:hypothetical protein CXB51_005295 [Gossypium anomalum]|uniref:Reverse transcriptase zinc-binding domain-containing protein n=1 Tax=Gossypium anomalum TaxID=47600 RepID=A0A8J5ZC32_9ROSI|nr:hypothetical protein CXB51_005295 [Gossypium anomalum]